LVRLEGVATLDDKQKISLFVRLLTLAAAELVFVGLVILFVVRTWEAKAGVPPTLSSVETSALGGLAILLGGGYGVVLGAQGSVGSKDLAGGAVKKAIGERALLFAGVVLYMFAGFAICITYGLNEAETPAVLRTIAIAFAGYVVAYISTAYQQIAKD
jgi:uncharacterized membrane-anchored protein YitT (DUF2179 family)